MRVLVTGAAGFVGQIVSRALLNDASNKVILTDISKPRVPADVLFPENAEIFEADLLQAAPSLAARQLDVAILLHGIMSSGAEADFHLGYRVNVEATKALLLALADANPGLTVIYASSIAVYGSPLPPNGTPISEAWPTTPESSYGAQKIICEAYINDLTRRGNINGFALRFPGITVRPGKPAAAVSSFMSGIIREPLKGEVCVVPMRDRQWRTWVCSPRTLVHNVLIAAKLPRDALPVHRRVINVPGFAVSIQEMLDALTEVGGLDKLEFVREEDDEQAKRLLYTFPQVFDNTLGLSLGMKVDSSFVQNVKDYVDDPKD